MTGASWRRQLPPVAVAAGLLLLGLHAGGYFPRAWVWAALIAIVAAAVAVARGRLPALRSPGGVALVAGVGLCGWSLLSMAWADSSSHLAWEAAGLVALYAATFVAGAANLATARTWARYAGWCGAGLAAVTVVAFARMATIGHPQSLFAGYRVDWPVGYVDGLAALCVVGCWLLLGRAVAWQVGVVRAAHDANAPGVGVLLAGAALAGAGSCMALLDMTQSRGAYGAFAVGLVAALVACTARVLLLVDVALLAVVDAAAHHVLGRPFTAIGDLVRSNWELDNPLREPLTRAADAAIHDAGRAGLGVVVAAGVVGVLATVSARALAGHRAPRASAAQPRDLRAAWGVATVVVVLLALFVPVIDGRTAASWSRAQVHGCIHHSGEAQAALTRTSHLSDVGTNRCDFWRVALVDARNHPLAGIGAGNFQATYIRLGESAETPRQAHSIELQLLGELGIVGLALGLTAAGAVAVAMWRYLRSGPHRDPVFAGGIAAMVAWSAHASIDWLWQLPVVTLPVVLLAGGLVACVSPLQARADRRALAVVGGGACLAAVALVAPVGYADAQLHVANSTSLGRTHPRAALTHAERAAAADPAWAVPVVRQAELQRQLGNRAEAQRLARRAVDLEPRSPGVRQRARLIDPSIAAPTMSAAHRTTAAG